MLETLKTVKIVTEFVEIQAGECSPTSLSFLGSLTTIEGRKLTQVLGIIFCMFSNKLLIKLRSVKDATWKREKITLKILQMYSRKGKKCRYFSDQQHALSITSNRNLLELGLRSLKRIRNGRVYIGNNEKLCYVDSLKEYWKEIMQTNNTSNLIAIIKNNQFCGKTFMKVTVMIILSVFVFFVLLFWIFLNFFQKEGLIIRLQILNQKKSLIFFFSKKWAILW